MNNHGKLNFAGKSKNPLYVNESTVIAINCVISNEIILVSAMKKTVIVP